MASGSYNGWKNWETWAADLWIDNEESNYRLEMEYFQRCERRHVLPTYTGFLRFAGCGFYNGDLSPKNSRICRAEITKRMREDFKDWQEHSA